MARPLRIQYPGAVYHVMNRGGSRQKVFLDEQDYQAFLKTVGEIHDRWGVELFAYCLMGNHYHVCLRTPEGNLSRVMRHLDGLYTQRFNRVHRRDGALFRGRYKAIVVDKDAYLAQVVRFIHLPEMVREVPYQVDKFEWLAKSSGHPLVLVVSAKSAIRTLKDFVEEARKKPLHHGVGDVFSLSFAPTVLLGERLGLHLSAVLGYLGAGPIAVAVVRGELDFATLAPATWRPHVLAGDVRRVLVWGPNGFLPFFLTCPRLSNQVIRRSPPWA